MQKDSGPTPTACENSASARRLEGKKSLATSGRGGNGRSSPSRGAGGVRSGRCPRGPCRGLRRPQGARERDAGIGTVSAGRKGLGELPDFQTTSIKFVKGISKVRFTPAQEENQEWSCSGPNLGWGGGGGPCPPSRLLPSCHRLTDDPVSRKMIQVTLVAQVVKNPPAVLESWVRSHGGEDPLEEGMAVHSSILAWRITRTEEPGGLQSMGSQRVAED